MIVDLTWERAAYVAVHMRESDHDEIMSNRWDDDPYSFAAEVMRTPGIKVACIDEDGMPVAMGGISSHIPGVGQAWLFLVAAELIAASMGLGWMLSDSQTSGRVDRIMFSSAGASMLSFWTWRSDRYFKAVE